MGSNQSQEKSASSLYTPSSSSASTKLHASSPVIPTTSSSHHAPVHHRISDTIGSAEIELLLQSKYQFHHILGKGASAEVYLIEDKATKEKFACKILQKSSLINADGNSLNTETIILSRIHHENLLSLKEIYETQDVIYFILELANGNGHDLMHGLDTLGIENNYNEKSIAMIFKQILLGVKYLHELGIIHRDLKMDNLLYSSSSPYSSSSTPASSLDEEDSITTSSSITVKIADFGLSALTPNKRTMKTASSLKSMKSLKEMWGTVEYFAPEIYEQAYGYQIDIWALGCLLYEMLTGELAFPSREYPLHFLDKISEKLSKKKELRPFEMKSGWKDLSPLVQSLIKGMLKRNPQKRLDIDECLSHPWITGEGMKGKLGGGGIEEIYEKELVNTKKIIHERTERRNRRYQILVKDLEKDKLRKQAIAKLNL